jgi:hypothetical protein
LREEYVSVHRKHRGHQPRESQKKNLPVVGIGGRITHGLDSGMGPDASAGMGSLGILFVLVLVASPGLWNRKLNKKEGLKTQALMKILSQRE